MKETGKQQPEQECGAWRPGKSVFQEDWSNKFLPKERTNFHLNLMKPKLSLPFTEDLGNKETCEITPEDTSSKTWKSLLNKWFRFFNKYVALKKRGDCPTLVDYKSRTVPSLFMIY